MIHSELDQFVAVAGLLVEVSELKTVFRELRVCCGLPFVFVRAVHAFDFVGVVVEVSVFWVYLPIEVISHPNALAGVGVGKKKHIPRAALRDDDGLDGNGLVGVDVKCGEHFFFPFRLSFTDALMIRRLPYEINFGVSRFNYNI